MSKNPTDITYWKNRSLSYLDHAVFRCRDRRISFISYLPDDAKLVDVSLDQGCPGGVESVTWKIPNKDPNRSYFMVVTYDAKVITVFHKGPEFHDRASRKAEWYAVNGGRREQRERNKRLERNEKWANMGHNEQ